MRKNQKGHDNSFAVSRAGFSEIILILVIVVLVGVVGVFVFQKSQPKQEVPQTQPVSNTTSTPTSDTPPPTTDSGWQKEIQTGGEYNNDLIGVSFKYPSVWKLLQYTEQTKDILLFRLLLDPQDNSNHGPSYVAPVTIALNICGVSGHQQPCQSMNEAIASELKVMDPNRTTESSNVIDGVEGTVIEGWYLEAGPLTGTYKKWVYFPWKNGYYLYIGINQEKYEDNFDQILSTFEFTE